MTAFELLADPDRFDVRLARHAPGPLHDFNQAGVLIAADIHVALRLGRFGGDTDEAVLLAAALAVRGPRLGHVCTELATIRDTVSIDDDLPVDLQALPWPDSEDWMDRLAASPLVTTGPDTLDGRPLRLVGTSLYLDRYWREERQVAADLIARSDPGAVDVDIQQLSAGLARMFSGDEPDHQRLAAASAVLRRFTVVAGGPGTGKTTTVARILALLDEQAEVKGWPPPLMALAAPTGKAAARLQESVRTEAATLAVSEATRGRLLCLDASTLHRLLGWRPDSRSRFRHHRGNRLPHDVVIVDETSMVSLSLMARLVEAVRSNARLVLVGDPGQLASVEAGAVLGDIVGPAAEGMLMRPAARALLAAAAGQAVPAAPATTPTAPTAPIAHEPHAPAPVGDGIVVLRRVHRFGGQIATLAEAVGQGDVDAAIAVLDHGGPDVRWIPVDVGQPGVSPALAPLRRAIVDAGRRVFAAAHAGDQRAALDALGSFRVLCAHRRGEYGASTWMARVEEWLAADIDGFAAEGIWYVGRPVLVTENDYGLKLYNGDTGVVVTGGTGHPVAVFQRGAELVEFSPTRLAAVDTVYAMTVHKSQGSQFDEVAVLLPDPASPILTRELLYTAITRARRRLMLVGTEAAVVAALHHPIGRASGLRRWLWDAEAKP